MHMTVPQPCGKVVERITKILGILPDGSMPDPLSVVTRLYVAKHRNHSYAGGMKALTLKPPFADAVAAGRKHIEKRSWGKNVRGRIAIHRGGPNGAIVAMATVVDVVTPKEAAKMLPKEASLAFGPLCWILKDVRQVGPYACKGRLSLWPVPDQIRKEIEKAQEKSKGKKLPKGRGTG
ncbi:MAG: hypothetical protein NVSMB9_09210 [Isosphaeraceae bacterium]